jgi:lincosamide nucleotidyltransferase B/F
MTSDNYRKFTERLRASLESDDSVVGLVALGSMAAVDYEPDQWSDHDFFVVVQSGAQERFRTVLSWLPDHAEIGMAFRETAHGVKVLYSDGHLLEFAVFDMDELQLARINRFRVLFDRADISTAMAAVQRETLRVHDTGRADDAYLIGMLLSNLLVGVGRYVRGERLSGTQFVKGHALGHLLTLASRHLSSERDAALDDLDPFRRFELAYPRLSRDVEHALSLTTPLAARALLDIAQREFAPLLERVGGTSFQAVGSRIDEALRRQE